MGAALMQTAVKEYSFTQLRKNGFLIIQNKKQILFYCSETMSYKNSQYHPTNVAQTSPKQFNAFLQDPKNCSLI